MGAVAVVHAFCFRAMAIVQGAEIIKLIVDGGESAKNLNRPGMEHISCATSSTG